MTDPIADMLTRLRNAVQARHQRVTYRVALQGGDRAHPGAGRLHPELQGADARATPGRRGAAKRRIAPVIRIVLKYGPRGENVISGLQRVSRRVGASISVVKTCRRSWADWAPTFSRTSRGIMTGREAIKAGVGGEVLCNIW
jgi:small subunit ribosomal protein S8